MARQFKPRRSVGTARKISYEVNGGGAPRLGLLAALRFVPGKDGFHWPAGRSICLLA